MQQIVYFVVKVIDLDDIWFEFLTKCPHLSITFQRPLQTTKFLSFFNMKGLGRRTPIKQIFECCLIINTCPKFRTFWKSL